MFSKPLEKLVTPPASPVSSGTDQQWAEAGRALSLKLPDDWKEFCQRYGSGTIFPLGLSIFNVSGGRLRFVADVIRQMSKQFRHDEFFCIARTPDARRTTWTSRARLVVAPPGGELGDA